MVVVACEAVVAGAVTEVLVAEVLVVVVVGEDVVAVGAAVGEAVGVFAAVEEMYRKYAAAPAIRTSRATNATLLIGLGDKGFKKV